MKYTALILLFACFAGCKKDDLQIAGSYFGSVALSYEITHANDTTISGVTVEIQKISDDSIFLMQRIPIAITVGVTEDTMKFGARIDASGNITIPPYRTSPAGGAPVITGDGEINGNSLSYVATYTATGLIIHYTFNGTAQ